MLEMTEKQKRDLLALEELRRSQEAALQLTRERWAALVEEAGQAAAGRALGMSTQAVHERLRTTRRARARGRRRTA